MSDSESKSGTETGVQSVVHTPGPWMQFAPEIDGQVYQDYRTIRGGMGLRGMGFELTGFVSEADARLIAAAPEMLAAIQGALRIENLWRPCGDWPEEHWEEAKALNMMFSLFEEIVHKVV